MAGKDTDSRLGTDAVREDLEEIVASDPAVLGGTPVFRGTRVPVTILFCYLAEGSRLEDFLEDYPPVRRTQAVQAIHAAGGLLAERSDSFENTDG